MEPDTSRVLATGGTTAGTTQVHHRDFPEIRADGESPEAAATRLAQQLSRALDSALTKWRRDAIEQAIVDVEAYAKARH